jgi:competence protein ComEA
MPIRGFDLNTASIDDLLTVKGIDRDWAQKIIDYRNSHGPFNEWYDLDDIPGFTTRHVNDLRRSGVTIGGKRAA